MDVYAKYKGGGFLYGIPSRDLTREEFEALSEDQKAALLTSGLYDIIDKPAPQKKAPAKE